MSQRRKRKLAKRRSPNKDPLIPTTNPVSPDHVWDKWNAVWDKWTAGELVGRSGKPEKGSLDDFTVTDLRSAQGLREDEILKVL